MSVSLRVRAVATSVFRQSARPTDAVRSSASPASLMTSLPVRNITQSSGLQMQPRSNPSDSAPAWSGKEHSDSMEIQPRASVEDSLENPTAKLDPLAYHPSGSSSEQIIAGDRSPIDPLKNGSWKHHEEALSSSEQLSDIRGAVSESDSSSSSFSNLKAKAPSLSEVEVDENEEGFADARSNFHNGP